MRKDDGKITASEFSAANLKSNSVFLCAFFFVEKTNFALCIDDDLFDWRGLGEDLADHVDDLSRLV